MARWLLCENHHDVLIAVGDAVRARLIDLASRHPEEFGPGVSGEGDSGLSEWLQAPGHRVPWDNLGLQLRWQSIGLDRHD